MKKFKLSKFIGKQLSRLKVGQSYYTIVMTTITALSLVNLAFPNINILILIILFPSILLGAFIIGYCMDKWNINTMDYQKSVEMSQRYLTTSDFKNNDFRMLQMEVMFEWLKLIQENKPLDFDVLKEKYRIFFKKWSLPKNV